MRLSLGIGPNKYPLAFGLICFAGSVGNYPTGESARGMRGVREMTKLDHDKLRRRDNRQQEAKHLQVDPERNGLKTWKIEAWKAKKAMERHKWERKS